MLRGKVLGRLTADAKNVTAGKSSFISMTVASNEIVNKVETTTFVTVNANTTRYANLLEHLKKGRLVYVEGNLTTNAYTDKNNQPKSEIKIYTDFIQFVSAGGQKSGENGETNTNTTTNATTAPATNDASQDMAMPPLKSKTKVKTEPEPAPAVAEAEASDDLPF